MHIFIFNCSFEAFGRHLIHSWKSDNKDMYKDPYQKFIFFKTVKSLLFTKSFCKQKKEND